MKLRSRYISLLVVGMLCMHVIVLGLWTAPQVGAWGRADVVVDVSLPSDSTGIPGGTLAVRIFAPASAGDARYADSAPVAIFVPGGTDAGTLRPALSLAEDVIRVVFLFPGGTDPLTGRSSDGTYDYRGANSIAALRDVILYAAGEFADSLGRTIDDVLPVSVLHDNIGLLGGSNGGNIIVAVAAEHGTDLAGHLRYVIQWESPVSSQIATADLGRVRLDCPPGSQASLSAVNPRYQSYGPLALDVDYSQLTYDAADPLHPVFFDGTGDGHYTTVVDPANGCQTPDLDLNGTLELNEDFPLATFSDGVKQFYSAPVTQALANQNVFGGSWPTDVATPPQAIAFWSLREAVRQYPAALANIPDLEGMVLASVVDHVQTAPDHPHIHQAFDGWDGNGDWVKINPARDYVLEVDPALSSRTDLPDNAANAAPSDWTDASGYAFPDDLDEVYFAAAVHEMADRAHATNVTPTPTSTLTSTSTPSPTPTLFPTHIYLPLLMKAWHQSWLTPTATPTPTPTSTSLPLTWQLEPGLRVSGEAYADPQPHVPLAPDVIQLDDGRYRMFYTVTGLGIGSATSDDSFNWTVEPGLRLESRRIEGELHFDVGHPTVVRLADGRWRMYHQTSTGIDTPLRLASAISSDGFNFTQEDGVRIDIGPDSELSFAGHGRAWRAADGSFWMLLSANTHDDTGPSDIALANSPDGLAWAIVKPHLFVDGHDPTLLVNPDGSVTALWMYLDQTFYTSDSAGGLQWSPPVEVRFYDEAGELLNYSSDAGGDVALLRLDDGSLRLFTNWSDGIRSLVPTQSPIPNIQSPYLLAFHACDTATDDCRDPRNHRVYLAQSDDGADWSLIPNWEPYQGSVPDVVRRGDSLYVYTPNQVRRYRFSTDTWEDPVPVTLIDPEATGGFVDPSPFVDAQGRLVLFYLLGIIGQNPASCAPEETTCVKHFHSAVEAEGSDGTDFVAEPGDRVQVTINVPGSASDPDIFYDSSRYVLYISRGANVQVYTSPTLHGSYTLSDSLPDGYLVHGAGVPTGHFDPTTARYWTYAHTSEGVIRRAVHASLDVPLSEGDFTTILSGSSIGLGASYRVESPGFAVNTPGPVPDYLVYLPLVARNRSPLPADPSTSDSDYNQQ